MATPNNSKCSLQNLLTALLAPANQEQSSFLPPSVFTSMVNTITAMLISKLASVFPENPAVIDMLQNFIVVKRYPITNGFIVIDPDYRNILGAPSIVVRNAQDGECEAAPPINNAQEFMLAQVKAGCSRRPIRIVPQSEFDYRTTSQYKKPTFWDPIGYWAGPRTIKVCPFDLTKVDVMYVKNEDICVMAYIQQPDDTFLVDQANTIDTQWTNAAFTPIFHALNHLYAAYSRDQDFTNWAMILTKEGIL